MYWRSLLLIILLHSGLHAAQAKKEPLFFYVVIPSYNNARYYQKNLASIAEQDYPHWKAIYINDCSQDQTGPLVDQYIQNNNLKKKFEVIHNKKRKGMCANIYRAVRKAKPNSVIITVDGDDTLIGNDVFSYLAKVYENPDVWMTYGNWVSEPPGRLQSDNEPIPDKVLKKNSFRTFGKFCTTQLRTFYAGLFRQIKKRDLQDKGKYFMAAGDVAFMLPLLEMSSLGHTFFVERVIYRYNVENPINDYKVNSILQGACARKIIKKKPYKPLRRADWLHEKGT